LILGTAGGEETAGKASHGHIAGHIGFQQGYHPRCCRRRLISANTPSKSPSFLDLPADLGECHTDLTAGLDQLVNAIVCALSVAIFDRSHQLLEVALIPLRVASTPA
jgi:hypothetical protein